MRLFQMHCANCCYHKPSVGGAEALSLIFGADAGISSRLCTSKGAEGPGDDLDRSLQHLCNSQRNLLKYPTHPITIISIFFFII